MTNDLISKQNITEDDIECEEFYNICQAYRHAKDNGDAGNAYSTLKKYIAQLLINSTSAAKCTNSDSWNCKYCEKTKDCEALADERNFGKPKPNPQPQSARDALEKAARVPEGKAEALCAEHAIYDGETGVWEFGNPNTEDAYNSYMEYADDIRNLIEHDAPSAPIENDDEPLPEHFYMNYLQTMSKALSRLSFAAQTCNTGNPDEELIAAIAQAGEALSFTAAAKAYGAPIEAQQTYEDGLEAAAKICEQNKETSNDQWNYAIYDCAEKIRALIPSTQSPKESEG